MLKNVKRLNIKHFQEKPCFLKLRKKEIFDIIEIFHAKLIMVMSLVCMHVMLSALRQFYIFMACFCKQKNMGLVDVEYFLYIYLIKSLDDGTMSSCLCILKKKTCCL